MIEDFLDDVKAFGGTPVFVFAVVFSFLMGYRHLSLQLFVGFVLCVAVTVAFRLLYFKERPDMTKYRSLLSKLDASSFPSLHSMRAFFLALILSLRFDNVFLVVLFFTLAVAVAAIRVVRKRHDAVDVIVGGFIGLVIAFMLSFI